MERQVQAITGAYRRFLDAREALSLGRSLPLFSYQPRLSFSSSDYLNLSQHPHLVKAAQQAAEAYGISGRGSRILETTLSHHRLLEEAIAHTLNMPKALYFCSGFQTNVSVLAALLNPYVLGDQPLVFCDRLNHASLHQGCALAGVRQIRYAHLDLNDLECRLKEHAHRQEPKFILTETLFSMDGDYVDVDNLCQLAEKYGAFVYLDEAHALGIFGKDGYGLAQGRTLTNCLIMGSFSKGLGASGGFVAGSEEIMTYLLNACQGFIYSTAPSPVLAAACLASWQLQPTLSSARASVLAIAQRLRETLQAHDFLTQPSQSHIIPVRMPDETTTLFVKDYFEKQAITVAAIRPPTVPPHTSRLRLSVHSQLTLQDVDNFVSHLVEGFAHATQR